MRDEIDRAFAQSIAAKRAFLRENRRSLTDAISAIANAFRQGNKLLTFGNGGSAADAQHVAAEFVNRYRVDRPPLPAIALTTDTSAITSIANDFRFDDVFAKQITALARPGDVALAISTSGNSANILRAVDACRKAGVTTIALTGGAGGRLREKADLVLCVSATTDTARIQETHILAAHVLCEQVDRVLFPEAHEPRPAQARPRRAVRPASHAIPTLPRSRR